MNEGTQIEDFMGMVPVEEDFRAPRLTSIAGKTCRLCGNGCGCAPCCVCDGCECTKGVMSCIDTCTVCECGWQVKRR